MRLGMFALTLVATSASGVVAGGPTFSLSTSLKNVHLNPLHHISAVFFPTARTKKGHHPNQRKRANNPSPNTTSSTNNNIHYVPYCRLRPLSLPGSQSGEDDYPSSAGPSVTRTRTGTAATPSSTSSLDPSQPTQSPGSGSGGGSTGPETGVINVKSTCGDIGATVNVTLQSGPNGSQDWVDCGLESDGGWQPQMVTLDDLVFHRDLATALKVDGSPYTACTGLLDIINKYANQYNLPSILIAAIALQESSCNPDTTGGGGEQGIMQISPEKCAGAPNGDCKDPDFNIMQGAKYLRNQLDGNGGNVLKTLGNYNGWYVGMTVADAKKAANTSCCRCQQNLDYVHAMVNGWLQNKNAYSPRMGKYFNLDICNGKS